MQRVNITFCGTTNRTLSLDPAEFRRCTPGEAFAIIKRELAANAPGVDFDELEIALASDTVLKHAANG